MFKATKEICQAFDKEGFKYSTEETEKSSRVTSTWGVKNGNNYRIQYISCDDDSDVSIRVYALLHIEDDKIAPILVALNKVNSTYRYAKFILDEDCDVDVEFDLPVATVNVGSSCVEMTHRFVNIIDEAYPILMKALWS